MDKSYKSCGEIKNEWRMSTPFNAHLPYNKTCFRTSTLEYLFLLLFSPFLPFNIIILHSILKSRVGITFLISIAAIAWPHCQQGC